MVVTVVSLAGVILLDSLLLVFDPALDQRCMAFAEEQVGSAWVVLSALAFLAPGCAFVIHGFFVKPAVGSVLMGGVSLGVGVFFALAAGERFAGLAEWWRSRSDGEYRLAGVAGVVLSVGMLVLAF